MSEIRNELLPKWRTVYSVRERLRSSLVFLLVLGLVAPLNLLLHEIGHCITIDAVGGKCGGIYFYPGVKIYPLNELGREFDGAWETAVGATTYDQPAPTEEARGLVSLMGSGTTASLSLLALLVLYIFRPRRGIRTLLLAQSLMFLDLLTYTVLPHWFDLPHFFVVGGKSPEPLNGAVLLGISESEFITGVLVFSLLMTAGLVRFVTRNR